LRFGKAAAFFVASFYEKRRGRRIGQDHQTFVRAERSRLARLRYIDSAAHTDVAFPGLDNKAHVPGLSPRVHWKVMPHLSPPIAVPRKVLASVVNFLEGNPVDTGRHGIGCDPLVVIIAPLRHNTRHCESFAEVNLHPLTFFINLGRP
jgi:hypothetical protein